jgi:3-oxoacyl-[acyl-carrier protein] reductase
MIFKTVFSINVLGAIKVIKKYEKALINNSGSVVLFSTVATQLGMPFHASIAASKAAVEGLAKSLAAEYATKIRFNVIAPTVTNTPLAASLLRNDKQKETMKERHPLKKYLEASEVASLAKYLLSDKSKSMSGQVFPMDAGIVSLKL